jgi:ribonuclease R
VREGREGGEHREQRDHDRDRGDSVRREGYLTINPRGFGFVASGEAAGDDVFVAKEGLMGAMHGDKVVVAIKGRGPRGPEGDIVGVLQRGVVRVAGVLRRRGKSAWLEPDDTRIRGPIVLGGDVDVRGPEGNSGQDGDAAVVALTRYPDFPEENAEGKLIAVLGKPGEINVEIAKVLVARQIAEVHSPEAFAEAEAFGATVPAAMLEGREDLTHIPLPTIDPEDARDHDDAVWVERADDGGYRAYIAIADVSAYVTPGTNLDTEAKARGCSVYLPDRAIPMLPRPLSSNLCSLLPDVVRLCLCAEVLLDAGGSVVRSRLIRGFMNSRAKLTYGGVARALGFTEVPPREPKADEMVEGLRVAYELSRLLRGKRMKRGALDFDLPEAKVVLDPEKGTPLDVQRRDKDPGTKKAYQLIEELMLLGNEVVARELVTREIPTIFRVHAPPDEKKLVRFAALAEQLGIPFEIELTKDPKAMGELLKSFATHASADVLNMLLLRSMKQATYDIGNVGHFGLASKAYLHFTSPIRRYPDIVAHRAVHKVVLQERVSRSTDDIGKLADAALAASVAERKAMEVEREVVDLYRAVLMKDRVGQRFVGTITAMVGSGIFVALDAPFVDVLVRFEDCGAERFELDDEGLRAVAKRSGEAIQLGDRMTLDVIDVSILRRAVYGRRVVGDGDVASKERNAEGRAGKGRPVQVRAVGKTRKKHDAPRIESSHGRPGGSPQKKPGHGKKKKGGRR